MNEVMHFTNNPETGGIAEVKVSQNDNAYGAEWADVVREYLKTEYAGDAAQCEVESFGKTYKVLKRAGVTAFYDAAGNTLFDVVNERLQKEYEWLMGDGTGSEEEDADGELPDVQTEPESGQGENTETGQSAVNQEDGAEKPAECIRGKDESGLCGAEAKLKGELEKVKEKDFAEPIIGYLIKRCKESESLAADICQNHKTWEKCCDYIYGQARKKLGMKSGPVHDEVVYEWAEDYYRLDDKELEEKKAKEEAERKKKAAGRKKQDAKKKADGRKDKGAGKAASAERTLAPKQEAPKPKPKKNELEGQMDMFSLMGM